MHGGRLPFPSRSLAAPLFALLVLAGCAGADVLHVDDPAPRPARDPGAVLLLLDPPDDPYRTIAVIRSAPQSPLRRIDALKRDVQARAARLGADAVILGLTQSGDGGGVGTAPDGTPVFVSGSSELRIIGRAIVFDSQR
jgi:hypothetical protein